MKKAIEIFVLLSALIGMAVGLIEYAKIVFFR